MPGGVSFDLGGLIGAFKAPLGTNGEVFRAPGSPFGSLWDALGRHLVPPGRLLAASGMPLDASGSSGRLWAPLGGSGRLWATLGAFGRLWALWGASGHLI